jgi:hypothetical protein
MNELIESVNSMPEDEAEIDQLTWETPSRLRDEPDPQPEDLNYFECPTCHGTFRGTHCPKGH